MRLAEHVLRLGEERKVYKALAESLKEGGHSEDKGIDGRKGLEWIFGRVTRGVWSGFNWVRIGTGGELLWKR
jgi:hypothetical protein